MTWDEWERARGRVAGREGSERADAVPGLRQGPAQGRPDLASSPSEKKAAAHAIEERLEPDTRKAGEWADQETAAAVKAFGAKDGDGWATSNALKKAHAAWGDQVKALLDRLGSEKRALGNTAVLFQKTDIGVGAQLRRPSGLDRL
ncbi:hypothetical protein ACFY93_24270 [Streptomyces sp. NPDC008313]|uniref:hypothetical protein n=1 Tax=Streptomyces sp. NPDC008313 TaxID=3364826 RepID=UPI0036E64075